MLIRLTRLSARCVYDRVCVSEDSLLLTVGEKDADTYSVESDKCGVIIYIAG